MLMRKLLLAALCLHPTCFGVEPAHAASAYPAFLSEGSHGAWTRCAAALIAGDAPTICGTDGGLTVCSSKDGSLWATRWEKTHAELFYASPEQEPVHAGFVEERSKVSALIRRGKKTFACEVEMKSGRMVVEWRKL